MRLTKRINNILEAGLGVRIKKVKPANQLKPHPNKVFLKRRLKKPVFIFSSIRSGSTLLSSILNAHSEILSPPETHFSRLEVGFDNEFLQLGMKELKLSAEGAQFLLWDAILARLLECSDKKILVEKTPVNVINWEQVASCWPKAKIIFLLRHPVSIAQSWQKANPDWPKEKVYRHILRYVNAVEEARQKMTNSGSITVKYEDILKRPEEVIPAVCDFMGVGYEPEMLDYGANVDTDTRYKKYVGDWGDKIKSGKIQKGRRLPKKSEIPAELKDACIAWGYLK